MSEARRMVHDKSMVWVCEGGMHGRCPGYEPLTFMRFCSFMKPLEGRNPSVSKRTTFLREQRRKFIF